jgi:hypothetical protein
MDICRECCILSGRGLCDELITRPEESYRQCYVLCDLETTRMRRPCPTLGCSVTKKNIHSKWGQVLLRKVRPKYTGLNPHFLENVKLLKYIWYSLSRASAVFWDVTSCTLGGSYQRIGRTCCLHFQGWIFFFCAMEIAKVRLSLSRLRNIWKYSVYENDWSCSPI